MGTFTNQVQGLVSEQKLARLEREKKQEDKRRRENQELELFYTLDNILYNSNETIKQNELKKLYEPKTRDLIIDKITDNGNMQDIYILTKKYNSILNKVYQGHKLNDKELIQKQKEAEKQKQKENKKQETLKEKFFKNKKKNIWWDILWIILFLILVAIKIFIILFIAPVVFVFAFLWYSCK